MKKVFLDSLKWSIDLKNYVGLPRPHVQLNENQRLQLLEPKLKLKTKIYLHKRIPVPWQSMPVFESGQPFNLNIENERRVYPEGLCGYCGVKLKDEENCSRWTIFDPRQSDSVGPRVFSDTHPLHMECMKQARVFCPFMRQRENSEFEYGTYKELRQNFINTTPNLPII